MAFVVKDRVKVTSTTTGTGAFDLGAAVEGFQDFTAISPLMPWDISASVYLQKFSVAAQETSPQGLFFKPDGLKMYIVGNTGDDVNEYDLSTAWDISTSIYLQNFSVSAQETNPTDVFFKPDGTKMYIMGNTGDDVNEYDLSIAWDISTSVYLQNFSVAAQETGPQGLFFKPDGLKMYIIGSTGDAVYEYDLSTAWDISTSVYLQNFSVAAQSTVPTGLFFKPDGTNMYFIAPDSNNVYEYGLSAAWDISTSFYSQSFSVLAQEGFSTGLFFKPDGLKMYVTGTAGDDVNEYDLTVISQTYYSITGGTDWEIGLGQCINGNSLVRSVVYESSNSNAAVNWGAGTKDVIATYPADATQGTVPTADNSSVGTDLVAWTNLKKYLDAGVINGVPYANGDVNGVVSTYSLAYTVNSAYRGGVLAPNGDIHFVPYAANRGQKISATGVVSTYSLVYTASQAYHGGVLAPNGDIHFVPATVDRGQKISASGLVSTYSLIYSTNSAYAGGVVGSNGDIHFVPLVAPVGQKVSTAGVVSTYSLIYTAVGAYNGGVLAPNGDIHFIPAAAVVGQKVSSVGVVSTYSLVNTAGAYQGGVLAPNGDIYFVNNTASVGQKISIDGVVSTYSLVYTTAQGAYNGGVLAPNGEIHFVPSNANVGQKISVSGVVSTYSLVYTALSVIKYTGGVLSLNGNIEFIPYAGTFGQRISTNVPVNIGYALNPYFNKF